MFMSFARSKFTLLYQNSVTDVRFFWFPSAMLELIHTQLYKFGCNISSYISFTNYFFDPNLGEGRDLPSFISQILDFICRMVLILIFIYFEWRDTENQQFGVLDSWSHKEIVRTRRFDCIGLNKTGSVFDLTVVA